MSQEDILLENINEFVRQARKAKAEVSFNSAATLFFKALAVMADLFILQKEGFIPSNHAERFKLLKEKYCDIYRIMDKDFPIYQDSYRLKISKQITEVMENDVKNVAKITGIKINSP